MKIIEQSVELLYASPIELMETAGRNCYQSEGKGKPAEFLNKIIKMGHLGVLEHSMVQMRIITDRATSHQLVRHRMASYCQESQRYCRYGKQVAFIEQGFEGSLLAEWKESCNLSEASYLRLLEAGSLPEDARSVLNNSCATKIVMTANLRSWKWIIKERTGPKAQKKIRELFEQIRKILSNTYGITI